MSDKIYKINYFGYDADESRSYFVKTEEEVFYFLAEKFLDISDSETIDKNSASLKMIDIIKEGDYRKWKSLLTNLSNYFEYSYYEVEKVSDDIFVKQNIEHEDFLKRLDKIEFEEE